MGPEGGHALAIRLGNGLGDYHRDFVQQVADLGRKILFNGYMGMELAVLPVYQAEVVPAQVRGLVVSTYRCRYRLVVSS